MKSEVEKPIPGHPDYFATSDGKIISTKFGKRRILKGGWSGVKREYQHVFLNTEGVNKFSSVHRLVCMAFHGMPPKGMEVRHLDGDSKNNKAINLAWATHRENMLDRPRHGTDNRGEKSPLSRLSTAEIRVIRKLHYIRTTTLKRLGEIFNISSSHAWRIVNRKVWKHI